MCVTLPLWNPEIHLNLHYACLLRQGQNVVQLKIILGYFHDSSFGSILYKPYETPRFKYTVFFGKATIPVKYICNDLIGDSYVSQKCLYDV